MFAIYDLKAHAYLPPFIIHRQEMAQRLFADCVNDPTHQFRKNPADYNLFQIGAFDDNTAKVGALSPKIDLGNGIEYFVPDSELAYNAQDDLPFPPALEDGELSPNQLKDVSDA